MINHSFKIKQLSTKILFFLTIDMCIRDNGMEMIVAVEECRFGKMDLSMRATGKKTLLSGMEDSSIQMEMSTLGNGKMIGPMEKV